MDDEHKAGHVDGKPDTQIGSTRGKGAAPPPRVEVESAAAVCGAVAWAAHDNITAKAANAVVNHAGHTLVDGTGGFYEYTFLVNPGGWGDLFIAYNAQDSRPLQVTVNGVEAGEEVAGVTGTWEDVRKAREDLTGACVCVCACVHVCVCACVRIGCVLKHRRLHRGLACMCDTHRTHTRMHS